MDTYNTFDEINTKIQANQDTNMMVTSNILQNVLNLYKARTASMQDLLKSKVARSKMLPEQPVFTMFLWIGEDKASRGSNGITSILLKFPEDIEDVIIFMDHYLR